MFTIYRDAIGATLVSLSGALPLGLGVMSLVSGNFMFGIPMLALGLLMEYVASRLAENKRVKAWKKRIQEKGLETQIRSDADFAIRMYNECPYKSALEHIRTLNPAAAEAIDKDLAAKEK